MARIQSVYNDIRNATGDVVDIISGFFTDYERSTWGQYLDSYIKGGFDQWKKDMRKYQQDYSYLRPGPLYTGFNEESTMGILKNRPELYVRIALAKMKEAREEGRFEQLSDEEFNSLVSEFEKDPKNFKPANRRAISIKYDKDLQKDIATRKGISTDDVKAKMSDFQKQFKEQQLEEWTKRQWQIRAGIIK